MSTSCTAESLTLDDIRAIPDPEQRVQAANAYIAALREQHRAAIRPALDLRDDDVRALVDQHGPSGAARRAHLSLSTVKTIRGRR